MDVVTAGMGIVALAAFVVAEYVDEIADALSEDPDTTVDYRK